MPSDEPLDAEKLFTAIRSVLDMDDDETLEVATPTFDRQDGTDPGDPPLTASAMHRLEHADKSELKELGLRRWSEDSGLWLLPWEWHPHIPDEYPLIDINGRETCRAEYPATPDKRFGVLSCGIIPAFEQPVETESALEVADDAE